MTKVLALNVLSAVSFIVGVFGLGDRVDWGWQVALMVFGFVLLGIASFLEWRQERENNMEFKDKNGLPKEEQVKQYMKEVIKSSGSVAIFTRNMSWVDEEVVDILKKKADKNDLKIVMESPTDASRSLEERGAKVIYYKGILPVPMRTRFTIIDAGSMSANLSIGHRSGKVHRIHRFADSSDPALSLAKDMLHLAEHAITNPPINDGVTNESPTGQR